MAERLVPRGGRARFVPPCSQRGSSARGNAIPGENTGAEIQEIIRMGEEILRGRERLRQMTTRSNNPFDYLSTLVRHSLPLLITTEYHRRSAVLDGISQHGSQEIPNMDIHLSDLMAAQPSGGTDLPDSNVPVPGLEALSPQNVEEAYENLMASTIQSSFIYSLIHLTYSIFKRYEVIEGLRKSEIKSDLFHQKLDLIERDIEGIGLRATQMISHYIQGLPCDITFPMLQMDFQNISFDLKTLVQNISSELDKVKQKELSNKLNFFGSILDFGATAAQTGMIILTPGYRELHIGYKLLQAGTLLANGTVAVVEFTNWKKSQETVEKLQANLDYSDILNNKWSRQYMRFLTALRELTRQGDDYQARIMNRALRDTFPQA